MPKIFYYFNLLSLAQQKRFRLWIASPYFNSRKDLIALTHVLLAYVQEVQQDDWEETVFNRWKKNQAFDQAFFRNSCSKLLKLLLQFLGMEQYQQQEHLVRLHQLQALNANGADKYFSQAYSQTEHQLQLSQTGISAEDFWVHSLMLDTRITFAHLQPKRQLVPDFNQANYYLDQYYLLRKLKYALAQQTQSQLLLHEAEKSEASIRVSALLKEFAHRPQQFHPLIHAYYHLLQAYDEEEGSQAFGALKSLLKTGLSSVSMEELREISTASINYCGHQIRQGNATYRQEMEEIYEIMIERDLLWINGQVVAWHVKNLTTHHLVRKNYAWVERFLEIIEDKLIPSHRQQITLYCQGLMYYFQQQYREARKAFEQLLARFDDVYFGLDIRIVKARLLYELNDSELEYWLQSGEKYIKSKDISPSQRIPRQHFFRLLKRLYNTNPYHKAKLHKLAFEIREAKQLNSQQWLLQQTQVKLDQKW